MGFLKFFSILLIAISLSGQVLMSITWWWIFHGVLTEPAHILPVWDNYPGIVHVSPFLNIAILFTEPEKWTDEELGIPPDDE